MQKISITTIRSKTWKVYLYACLVMIFLVNSLCVAATIIVPDQQPTIQSAVDIAVSQDTILVLDGVYTGDGNRDIVFGDRQLVVRSANGPDVTTIDCQGTLGELHRAFTYTVYNDSLSALEGLSIINGINDMGGAIYINHSAVTVKNCIIRDCFAGVGGAIYLKDSSPTFFNCVFDHDSAGLGGCMYNDGYDGGEFIDCTFTRNRASSNCAVAAGWNGWFLRCVFTDNGSLGREDVFYLHGAAVLEDCLFADNYGGIRFSGALFNVTLRNCTIVNNAKGIFLEYDSFPLINSCIIAFNDEYAIHCYDAGPTYIYKSNPRLYYCNVFGNGNDYTGCLTEDDGVNGNISADPLFFDTALHIYELRGWSPCVDSGDPDPQYNDPDGTRNDIGAFYNAFGTTTDEVGVLPTDLILHQNFPNPFNPATAIGFSLPRHNHVRLDIFNILGERVATLVDQYLSAGEHEYVWSGRDRQGQLAAGGVYFYRMTTGYKSFTRKMILLK